MFPYFFILHPPQALPYLIRGDHGTEDPEDVSRARDMKARAQSRPTAELLLSKVHRRGEHSLLPTPRQKKARKKTRLELTAKGYEVLYGEAQKTYRANRSTKTNRKTKTEQKNTPVNTTTRKNKNHKKKVKKKNGEGQKKDGGKQR